MPLSLLNHSALALFAQRTRIPTSARSIGFCAIWVCISSSSSSAVTESRSRHRSGFRWQCREQPRRPTRDGLHRMLAGDCNQHQIHRAIKGEQEQEHPQGQAHSHWWRPLPHRGRQLPRLPQHRDKGGGTSVSAVAIAAQAQETLQEELQRCLLSVVAALVVGGCRRRRRRSGHQMFHCFAPAPPLFGGMRRGWAHPARRRR